MHRTVLLLMASCKKGERVVLCPECQRFFISRFSNFKWSIECMACNGYFDEVRASEAESRRKSSLKHYHNNREAINAKSAERRRKQRANGAML